MKFSINRKSLLSGLFTPHRIVEGKESVLSNIQIEALSCQSITFKATDLAISVCSGVAGNVVTPGIATVPGKTLFSLISSLDAEEVVITKRDSVLEIEADKGKYELNTMLDEDFPSVFVYPDHATDTFEPRVIAEIIDKTLFSVSTDDSKPHLMGISFSCHNHIARGVSTDGHRLAMAEFAYEGDFQKGPLTIPKKGAQEIKRLAEESPTLLLGFMAQLDMLAVATANLKMTIKLITSPFPSYKAIIPNYEEKQLMVVRAHQFKQILKRISIISDKPESGVILQAHGGIVNGILKLSGTDSIKGSAAEEMDVNYRGESVSVIFNIKYLAEILSKIDGPEFLLVLGTPKSAALVKSIKSDFVAVIMPVRISEGGETT